MNQARNVFRLGEDDPTRVADDPLLPRPRLTVRLVVMSRENMPMAQFACAVALTVAALAYVVNVVSTLAK